MHIPVMVKEVIEYLNPKAGGVYIDCTVGDGGHSAQILNKIGKKGSLIGMDWDRDAIKRASENLKNSENAHFFNANFCQINQALKKFGAGEVDGILFDLGFSYSQILDENRGFSFLRDGPLDMRMSKDLKETARDVINLFPEEKIRDILFKYGQENYAKPITRYIVRKRKEKKIETTTQLSNIIKMVYLRKKSSRRTKSRKRRKIHFSTKTFQALRIYVNNEIENLKCVLPAAVQFLKIGGRICVISFHSLEDRVVKIFFKESPNLKIITKKPEIPSISERKINPRSRSAKLRVAEKIDTDLHG